MTRPYPDDEPNELERLVAAVDNAAHLLPAQGPISVFIHHNTLHAFEVIPFESAVVEAAALFGCEPYMSEDRYRAELERGRIRDADLHRSLELELGPGAAHSIGSWGTRLAVRFRMLRHSVHRPSSAELRWLLAETDVLDRLRADVPDAMRARLLGDAAGSRGGARRRERAVLHELWDACRVAAAGAVLADPPVPAPVRHRDLLCAVAGADADADALAHPLLIRVCAAFLDQGVAPWPLLEREGGLYRAFLQVYAPPCGGLDRGLVGVRELIVSEDPDAGSAVSVRRSLAALGVPPAEWESLITRSLLALRGWAGMIRQFELRPDRAPTTAPPASLMDFLAVRLLLDRAALAHVARRELGFTGPLADLRDHLRERVPPAPVPTSDEAAFVLFQLAQLAGRAAGEVAQLPRGDVAALFAELRRFGQLERRRMFHLAYERRYRVHMLDALYQHSARGPAPTPAPEVQAIFCIDEREESIRRHLEEVYPACETFGAAGFFGVAMYYRGVGDAHPVPLCPIAVQPSHEVEEVPIADHRALALRGARARRSVGRLARRLHVGSRTLARGTMITTLLGALAAIPLVGRVLFPRLTSRVRRGARAILQPAHDTELLIDRRADAHPHAGAHLGYTKQEMADIVAGLLTDIGVLGRAGFAPLVLVVGHGSSSLNNPHESAHDCGACGGGRGGPNARAFAQMANDPAVRSLLAARGTPIPSDTWFVGAFHNSCDDSVELFEAARVGEPWRESLARVRVALNRARARNAHERCRRFENVPTWFPPALALAHVEGRAEDLAQVRPEYGHATNAMAIIGRRERTRGLFLDRRVFLVSYDPTHDDAEGSILAGLLGAVIPVCAGINLEYYFSYVDSVGYGCGTKLPHNVAGYVGVMDGHQSDLRTGLPWQMVEIHEPMRLTVVVETRPELLTRIAARHPVLGPLIVNRWLRVATMDPDTGELHVLGARGARPHDRESDELPTVAASADWYAGRRDHLPCARIAPEEAAR